MSMFTNDVTLEGGNAVAVKVDGSGVTQPVSGTVTVTQATGTNLHVTVDGTVSTIGAIGSTTTIAQVSVTSVSTTILAANASRKKAIISSPMNSNTFIALAPTASTTLWTYQLTTNGVTIEVTNYSGAISGIVTGASRTVNVTEIA